MKKLGLLLLVLLVASCSSGGGNDAGIGDGDPGDSGAEDGGDRNGDAGDKGNDVDVGEHFTLAIPAGAEICSIGGGGDVFLHFAHQVRATCKPGQVVLPREIQTFEADWIERVEVSPDGAVLAPKGPGMFTRSIKGTADDGKYYYEFVQPYELNGQDFELAARVEFTVEGGVMLDPVMTLDEETLTTGYKIGLYVVFPDQERSGASCACGFDLLRQWGVNITTANGDIVYLRLRTVMSRCPPGMPCAGGTGEGEVVFARFERGQTVREVDDFFQTAFTAVHHLGGQSYIVVFEQPVDAVRGIAVIRDPLGGEGKDLSYLDADLNVIGTSEITFRDWVQE